LKLPATQWNSVATRVQKGRKEGAKGVQEAGGRRPDAEAGVRDNRGATGVATGVQHEERGEDESGDGKGGGWGGYAGEMLWQKWGGVRG
jgi:hypothetical protein